MEVTLGILSLSLENTRLNPPSHKDIAAAQSSSLEPPQKKKSFVINVHLRLLVIAAKRIAALTEVSSHFLF